MKTLRFEGERGAKRFEMIWQGFCLGLDLSDPRAKRSLETMRREAKVCDVLTGASAPKLDGAGKPLALPTGETLRTLTVDCTLSLEQADVDLLKTAIGSVSWRRTATPDAVDAVDFLSAAPEGEKA